MLPTHVFCCRKFFISSSGFSSFCHRVCLRTRKPQKVLISKKLIFRGIKSIYVILSIFVSILCVHDKTPKVLLKVIKEHLLLKLIETYYWLFLLLKPKWYVDFHFILFIFHRKLELALTTNKSTNQNWHYCTIYSKINK